MTDADQSYLRSRSLDTLAANQNAMRSVNFDVRFLEPMADGTLREIGVDTATGRRIPARVLDEQEANAVTSGEAVKIDAPAPQAETEGNDDVEEADGGGPIKKLFNKAKDAVTGGAEAVSDAAGTAEAIGKDIVKGVRETPGQIVGGVIDAVNEINQTLAEFDAWIADKAGLEDSARTVFDVLTGLARPEFETTDDPESVTGGLIRTTSQFVAGGAPVLRATKGIKYGGQFLRWTMAGAASDFSAFDPDDPTIADMLSEIGELEHSTLETIRINVVDALAKSETDDQFQKRLKNLGAGALAGGAIDSLTALYRGARFVANNPGISAELRRIMADDTGSIDLDMLRARTSDDIAATGDLPVKGEGDVIATPWAAYKDDPDQLALPGFEDVAPRARNIEGTDFNFQNLDTTADALAQVETVSKVYAKEIAEEKKGVVPLELTRQLADLVAGTPEQAERMIADFAAGGGVEDLHVKALVMRKMLVQSAEELDTLARKVGNGGPDVSDADFLAFRQHLTRHAQLQSFMKSTQTEIARALSSFRIPAGAPSVERAAVAEELINSMGGRATATEMAKRYLQTPVRDRGRFIEKAWGAKAKDVVFEIWINGLLSSPATHAVNFTSNTLFTIWQVPERATAALIGSVSRNNERVRFGEAIAQVHGATKGFGEGLRLAYGAWRSEVPSDSLSKIEAQQYRAITPEKFGLDPESMKGRAIDFMGRTIRIPGRALMAADEFNKAVAYRMELYAQAYRASDMALADGATAEEAAEIYTRIMRGEDEAIEGLSREAAQITTFTNPLGEVGQSYQRLVSRAPALRIITPFIRTPVNIVKEFGKRSPFALAMPEGFRREVAAGGARRDLALAKLSLGSASMTWAASMALEGLITGGGPHDLSQRRAWLETHRPYSMKIGDEWVPYGRLEPLAMLFGVSADMADFYKYSDDQEVNDFGAAQALGAVTKNLGEKTFLQGLGAAAEAINDPERYGTSFVQNLTGSAMPFSSAVSDAAEIMDPIRRERRVDPNNDDLRRKIDTILNPLRARTPGLSDDLPPKRTFWGEEIRASEGGQWWDAFNPFKTWTVKESVIDEELVRLGGPLSMPARQISNVKLSPEQYDVLLTSMNKITVPLNGEEVNMREYLNWYVRSPAYLTTISDETRVTMLRDIRNRFVDEARNRMLTPGSETFDMDLFSRVTLARVSRAVQ